MAKSVCGTWIALKAGCRALLLCLPSLLQQIQIRISELLFPGDRMDLVLRFLEKIKVEYATWELQNVPRTLTRMHIDVHLIARDSWKTTSVLRDGHDEVNRSFFKDTAPNDV